MDDPTVPSIKDPLSVELPLDSVITEPSGDSPNTETDAHQGTENNLAVDGKAAPEELPIIATQGIIEPGGVAIVVPTSPVLAPPLAVKTQEPSPDPSEDRGWLHRDLLSNTESVPLGPTSDLEETHEEVAVEEENSGSGIPNVPSNTMTSTQSGDGDTQCSDTSLEHEPPESPLSLHPLDEQGDPVLANSEAATKQDVASQLSPKIRNAALPNRSNSLEAKKNRLQDILKAKTKDLSMGAQKQLFPPKPDETHRSSENVEADRDSGDLCELPPNTEIVRPAVVAQTPEPILITDRDSPQLKQVVQRADISSNEPRLIINKPVTQIMAKSKRKAKKPLPNRSSLESMIDAASDLTDFFSIANTLDDSEEEDVVVVSDHTEPASSSVAQTPKDTPSAERAKSTSVIKAPDAATAAQQKVATTSSSDARSTAWVAKQGNVVTFSQPTSTATGTMNIIHTTANRPSSSQAETPQPSLAPQQAVNPQPQAQLGQPTQYVQQVLQPQQPQLSLLQQKLIQPLQPGSILPQGQILVQGNIVQGNILQTGLTSVGGVQQTISSTGSLIMQQAQQPAQQQFVPLQQVPVGSPVIQQTAVIPSVYQSQLPIIQQTAHQLPVSSTPQANNTIFTCSSPTPTLIKPQQTVFLLQRGDTLKLDSHGNLIVVGKESQEGNTGQLPIIQPGSSILPVNTVKNLLNTRHHCDTSVSQEPAGMTVSSSVAQRGFLASTTASQGSVMQVTPTVSGHTAISSFNRPVVIGKQPVASVQPQRQKSLCPNPELELMQSTSCTSGSDISATPTRDADSGSMKSEVITTGSGTSEVPTTASTKGGIKIFQCEKCKKLFVSKASLFNHLAAEMHTDNIPEHVRLPYRCNACDARFAFKASLSFHHSRPCVPEKPAFNIICSICKLRFKALVDLERHVVRCHHLLPSQNPEFVNKDPDEKQDKYLLPRCARIFPKPVPSTLADNPAAKKWNATFKKACVAKEVKSEGLSVITETADSESRPPIKLVMSVKRKKKSRHHSKKRRRSSSEHGRSASHCAAKVLKDQNANTRNLINTHGRYLNKSQRPFSCKICSKGFTSEHCLLEHIKTHIKPFSCSLCGWKSARKDNVLKHIQLQHGGPEYRRKRASKSKKSQPSPVSSEGEEEDLMEVEGEVRPVGEEDERSDNEDPEMELDDDDLPNDYFGSEKYHGYDDSSDDDNSRGGTRKTDKKASDKHADKGASGNQGKDGNGKEPTTPVPPDHNYVTHMQSSPDSTDPTQEKESGANNARPSKEVDRSGTGIAPDVTYSSSEKTQVKKDYTHLPETDVSKLCSQDGMEISDQQEQLCSTARHNKGMGDLKIKVNSSEIDSHTSGQTTEAASSEQLKSSKNTPSIVNENSQGLESSIGSSSDAHRVQVLSSQESGSSDSSVTPKTKDTIISIPKVIPACSEDTDNGTDASTEQNTELVPACVTQKQQDQDSLDCDASTIVKHFAFDVVKVSKSPDDAGTQTRLSNDLSAEGKTHQTELLSISDEGVQTDTIKVTSEVLPGDSENTSLNDHEDDVVENKGSIKSLSDFDSDEDILEWTSSDHDSDEESVLAEDGVSKIQPRPILLRDEEESQTGASEALDESVVIDDENLEIRPKYLKAHEVASNNETFDDTDRADEVGSRNTYYTVLNAEGSESDPHEDGYVAFMDGTAEAEIPESTETDNVFPVSSPATEPVHIDCLEGEDESSVTDVSQEQAKCSTSPDVRVKTEYLTLDEADMDDIPANETLSIQSPRESGVSSHSRALDHPVEMDSHEGESPEEEVEDDIEQVRVPRPQLPKQCRDLSVDSTVRVKQEPVNLEEADPQVVHVNIPADGYVGGSLRKAVSPLCSSHDMGGMHTSELPSATKNETPNENRATSPRRREGVDLVDKQQQTSKSLSLSNSAETRQAVPQTSKPSREQVLPIISAVSSLREAADRIEGTNPPRKSVILEALNRPSQQYPPQQFGPTSPSFDPRAMYNAIGVPMMDPSTGQPYLPRFPHPSNPYISMFHSGSLVDPRDPYFPGHLPVPPPAAMNYCHRPPHMGATLPESRFPSPNCFPPVMDRGDSYPESRDYQVLEKQRPNMHKMPPDKHQRERLPRNRWEKQKHQHLRKRLQERQQFRMQNGYPPHGYPSPKAAFSSASPGSTQPDRFIFPKYPYEESVGNHMMRNPTNREPADAVISASSHYHKANSRRQRSEETRPHDLQIVPTPHEFSEIGKQPIHLEQNNPHGTSSQRMGDPYSHAAHIPGRPVAQGETPISARATAPPLRQGLPGDTSVPQVISGTAPNHEINIPRQVDNGLQNDQPPPLVYQGPQKAQDLSLQKPTETPINNLPSKGHPLEGPSRRESTDPVDVPSDPEKTVQFSEYAREPQNGAEVTSPRDSMQPISKPLPPAPPPPALHSLYDDPPGKLPYGQGESMESRISHPPLAHQHHPPPEYMPGTSGSFIPPPIHVGPSHIPSSLPSPKSVPCSPKKRHSSSGSSDQQKSPRRRKRSRADENPEDRPYACHICGNRFKRSNNLTDHVRIHSRPYKCGECSFDTTRWQYLADHLKKNHSFEGDAKELEMMFKSGKRLKPTDHIPETCYQPLASKSKIDEVTVRPVRNGFSPGSRSMVVPPSTIILPRGSDIVHRGRSRKRSHHVDDDQDEDLVDFFGVAANQEDEDSTVTPVTLSKVSPKEELDDAESGSANGSQISPGSAQAQTSPKESPITPPKSDATWSKRKQLIPIKVTEDLVQEEITSGLKTTSTSPQENGEVNHDYDLMVNRMEEHILEEAKKEELEQEESTGKEDFKQEDNEEKVDATLEDETREDEMEEEDKEGSSSIDSSDQDCSATYHVTTKVNDSVDESDEDVMYTPSGRPKRRTGNYTFKGKQRRHSENEDPEYKPNRQRPFRKKRGIMLKIHIKRGKKRGRPRSKAVSDSSSFRAEALSTHIGGGLDLTPYYTIVDTNSGDLDRRPYQCKFNDCNKRFKSKQHMREHLFTHLKPYKCDGCGMGFARTDYLAMHMRDMHKMSPTRADLYNKRKCANGRAMACRMRPSKDKRRQELQQSFQINKEL
ncbi:uncharacterized protein LOC110975629 [Acanthaster planci]|uniref:Uncharacterized protein LOC110975629 n=1 Tax=Acanthaster planci TaxID=133434 RepID=A0A8B7XUM7_ACAPL|nr:uncharacterized protein LOC110975629 [Acanthaster planci]XP_022083937.1 uncharacterized protein LOC110975629 [Acanthaster planci]XP_022083938.1 uncharacterized protein LOC110975629 [Acanthaster planci]XP_022083939.1 uncharacterized protein LOC110975629 [Acanthaster planci]XP_022083940.1 uncharacterized protein LOC110975629 [Acanthaster planci]XP_022083941.1 uncharacterized protein LOC110975629 [Acanthaster planci]XP_022083942.1 uncharacterized protein LOC110975629 [Acanthaster planci]